VCKRTVRGYLQKAEDDLYKAQKTKKDKTGEDGDYEKNRPSGEKYTN